MSDSADPRVAEILTNNAHNIEELSEQISDLINDAVSEYISEFNSENQLTYDEVMALYEAVEAAVTNMSLNKNKQHEGRESLYFLKVTTPHGVVDFPVYAPSLEAAHEAARRELDFLYGPGNWTAV